VREQASFIPAEVNKTAITCTPPGPATPRSIEMAAPNSNGTLGGGLSEDHEWP